MTMVLFSALPRPGGKTEAPKAAGYRNDEALRWNVNWSMIGEWNEGLTRRGNTGHRNDKTETGEHFESNRDDRSV